MKDKWGVNRLRSLLMELQGPIEIFVNGATGTRDSLKGTWMEGMKKDIMLVNLVRRWPLS